jgi:hypothetical protein
MPVIGRLGQQQRIQQATDYTVSKLRKLRIA